MTFRDRHHTVRLSIRTMPLADPEAVARLQALIAAAAAAAQATAAVVTAELPHDAVAARDARYRAALELAARQPIPQFLRRFPR